MKLIILAFLAIWTLTNAQFTTTPPDPFVDEQPQKGLDLGTELISALINSDLLQNKLQRVYELVDLKIRLVKLIRALLSRQNLALVRQILDYVARSSGYLAQFLPEPAPAPRNSIFEVFFPSVTLAPAENDNIQRVSRESEITPEDEQLLEKHGEDVLNVTKLINNTP